MDGSTTKQHVLVSILYEGTKSFWRQKRSVTFVIIEHKIIGSITPIPSIIELIAFAHFQELLNKLFQSPSLFLSAEKLYNKLKVADLQIGGLTVAEGTPYATSLISKYIYERVVISGKPLRAGEAFAVEVLPLSSDLPPVPAAEYDVTHTGPMVIGQLPHIDHVKFEIREPYDFSQRPIGYKRSEVAMEWERRLVAFQLEKDRCDKAFRDAFGRSKVATDAVNIFLVLFSSACNIFGGVVYSTARIRWIKAIRRVLLQARVRLTTMHLDRIQAIRLSKLARGQIDPLLRVESDRKMSLQEYITLPSFLKVKISGQKTRPTTPSGGNQRSKRLSSASVGNSSSNININPLHSKHSSISSITSTSSSHTHTATTSHASSHNSSNSGSFIALPAFPSLSKIITPQLSRLNSLQHPLPSSPENIENGKTEHGKNENSKPGKGKRDESGSLSPKRGKTKRRSTRNNTMCLREALEEHSLRIKNIEDPVEEHSLKDLTECSSFPASRDSDMNGSMNVSMIEDILNGSFCSSDTEQDTVKGTALKLKSMQRGIEEGEEKVDKEEEKKVVVGIEKGIETGKGGGGEERDLENTDTNNSYMNNRTNSTDSSDNLSFNGSWKEEKEFKDVRSEKEKKKEKEKENKEKDKREKETEGKEKKGGKEGEDKVASGLLTPPQSPFDYIIRKEHSFRFNVSSKSIDIGSSNNSTRIKNDNNDNKNDNMNGMTFNTSTKINHCYTNEESYSNKNDNNSFLNREMSMLVDHILPQTISKERSSAKMIIQEHSNSEPIRNVDFPVLLSPRLSPISTPRLTPSILSPIISPITTPISPILGGYKNNNNISISNNVMVAHSDGPYSPRNGNSNNHSHTNSYDTSINKSNSTHISSKSDKSNISIPLPKLQFHLPLDSLSPLNMHSPTSTT